MLFKSKSSKKVHFLKGDNRVLFFGLDVRTAGFERVAKKFELIVNDAIQGGNRGCLYKISCGMLGQQQVARGRTVGVRFAPKPLSLAPAGGGQVRYWAEEVEERLCLLAQVPQLAVIDIQGTGYSLELLALGVCNPLGRKTLTKATLAYVCAGMTIDVDETAVLPRGLGYRSTPVIKEGLASTLDTVVVDFMNPHDPTGTKPAVIGTRNGTDTGNGDKGFAQVYTEFCDLFAAGCLHWEVVLQTNLKKFSQLRSDFEVDPEGLRSWIAKMLKFEKRTALRIVEERYDKIGITGNSLLGEESIVQWRLQFQVTQEASMDNVWQVGKHGGVPNGRASMRGFEPAAVLSSFLAGYLIGAASQEDAEIAAVIEIQRTWRKNREKRVERAYQRYWMTNRKKATESGIILDVGKSFAHAGALRIHRLTLADKGMGGVLHGKSSDSTDLAAFESVDEDEESPSRSRAFTRTDKLKALRQMILHRASGTDFDKWNKTLPDLAKFGGSKKNGEVRSLSFTCVDVRSNDLGPWHVALVAAWLSHHPEVTELRLGGNSFIGKDEDPDTYIDPWRRTVKCLVTGPTVTSLDLSRVGMGAAGLLVLIEGGLIEKLTSLNLGHNPLAVSDTHPDAVDRRTASLIYPKTAADVWLEFCEAMCQSKVAALDISKTGVNPQELSLFSDCLHKHADHIDQHGALRTIILAENDLTTNGDTSGLAIFLMSATFVKTLDISQTGLEAGCAEVISNELSDMPQLASLNIAGNDMGVAGAALLAPQLRRCGSLKSLIIGDAASPVTILIGPQGKVRGKLDWTRRKLGPADAVILSTLLSTLTWGKGKEGKIDLSSNELGNVGKASIAAAIRNWDKGTFPLRLFRIDIGSQKAAALHQKLEGLQLMQLRKRAADEGLATADTIEEVMDGDSPKDVLIAMLLANVKADGRSSGKDGFKFCMEATDLKLSERELTPPDVLLIAAVLEKQKHVDTLDLSDNPDLISTAGDGAIDVWHKFVATLQKPVDFDDHHADGVFGTVKPFVAQDHGGHGGFLWTEDHHDVWIAYTKKMLGCLVEEEKTGCRRAAKQSQTEYGLDEQAWWRLCQSIKQTESKITDLNLSDVGLTPASLLMLADGFNKRDPYLKQEMKAIDLHKNVNLTGAQGVGVKKEDADGLQAFLSRFGNINELNVAQCNLGDKGAEVLGNHVHKIAQLNIVGNPNIGVQGATSIADNIMSYEESQMLVKIRLPGLEPGKSDKDDKGFLELFKSSKGHGSSTRVRRMGLGDDPMNLQAIKLGNPQLPGGEVVTIPFFQKESQAENEEDIGPKRVPIFSFPRHGLRDPDAIILAAALPTLHGVEEVDLHGNNFGKDGKLALAKAIAQLDDMYILSIDVGDHDAPANDSAEEDMYDADEMPKGWTPPHTGGPSVAFGGLRGDEGNRHTVDLKGMELRAEDMYIVAAWMRASRSAVHKLNLSKNDKLFDRLSTRDANGDSEYVSDEFIREGWQKLCDALRYSNVQNVVLKKVGLTADDWCINSLARMLECVPTLQKLDISENLSLSSRPVKARAGRDADQKLWDAVEKAKRVFAEAMVRRSEGDPYEPMTEPQPDQEQWRDLSPLENEVGEVQALAVDLEQQLKRSVESTHLFGMAEVSRGIAAHVCGIGAHNTAYLPLTELMIEMGCPSSPHRLGTTFKPSPRGREGDRVREVEPHQDLHGSMRNRSLRADDAELLAALVTVWDNTAAVTSARLDVSSSSSDQPPNMLGLSGRKKLVDAFTRGKKSTFTQGATLKIDMGRWNQEMQRKSSKSMELKSPIVGKDAASNARIDWSDKGLAQKQLALLSVWLREALAHKSSKVKTVDLGDNPHLGRHLPRRGGSKEQLITVIVGDDLEKRKSLKRLDVNELYSSAMEQQGTTEEDIEAKILALPSMQGQTHGLDEALLKMALCNESATKVTALKLNNCGLTAARLAAVAEAIRPEQSGPHGLKNLSDLYLNDNVQLVRGISEKGGGWDKLCRSVAQVLSDPKKVSFLNLANCQLSKESMEILTTRLHEMKDGKRITTIDISDNESMGSGGGDVLAKALVMEEHKFPVVELVVGCIDGGQFLADQDSSLTETSKDKKDEEKDVQMLHEACLLPLQKVSPPGRLQYKQRFLPTGPPDASGELTGGREFNFEGKKISPEIAWIFGEWLNERNNMFRASPDMLITTINLKGNPLTGSKPRHKKQADERESGRTRQISLAPENGNRSRQAAVPARVGAGRTRPHMQVSPKKRAVRLYAGSEELWSCTASEDEMYAAGHGSCIDADSAGFGKLCKAFGLPTITNVDVSYCGLGPEAMHEMTKTTHYTDSDVPWLKTANLRSLNLSCNPIGVDGREHLKEALRDADIQELIVDMGGVPYTLDASVKTLDFSESHDLEPQDIIIVAGWITAGSVKKHLTGLNISGNHIISTDSHGFQDLMDGIPHSCVTKLEIRDVGLDPNAAKQVATMIISCSEKSADLKLKRIALKELDISGNTFVTDTANGGQSAWREFCEALGKSTLEKMEFSKMGLDATAMDRIRIAAGEMRPSQIKSINILGNPAAKSDKVIEALRGANTALQQKMIISDEQLLTLNENNGQTARYLDHFRPENQPAGKTKEDIKAATEALSESMGFGSDGPYNTVRFHPWLPSSSTAAFYMYLLASVWCVVLTLPSFATV